MCSFLNKCIFLHQNLMESKAENEESGINTLDPLRTKIGEMPYKAKTGFRPSISLTSIVYDLFVYCGKMSVN